MPELWERHIGVYGVSIKEGRIFLIDKVTGPYKGRVDLPGGKIEINESLVEALKREFYEETGFSIKVIASLGTFDFLLPHWSVQFNTFHHIAILYKVDLVDFSGTWFPTQTVEQDSSGAKWVDINFIDETNSSPLVCAVKNILNNHINFEVTKYSNWV